MYMMISIKRLIASVFLLTCFSMFSQTTMNLTWLKSIGGETVNDILNGMHVDGNGNVYIAGRIQSAVDLDPGPGTFTVDPNNRHAFFGKYNSSGNLIWATYLDGEGESEAFKITTDAAGDVYVAGEFEMAPLDFNLASPGTNTLAPADKDIFLLKYTANGAFSWVRAIGSPSATMRVENLKVNSAGEVVMGGTYFQEFGSPVNFNPAGPTFTLSGFGNTQVYFAKYSSTGALVFAEQIGGPYSDSGWGLDLDANDNIYLCGAFKDTIYFGGAPITNSLVGFGQGYQDMYTAKYSSGGTFIWGKAIGGTGDDGGFRLKVMNNNEFVIAGFMYSPTMDADPSLTAATNLTLVNTYNEFDNLLLKYSTSTGNLIWGKNTGGNGMFLPYILNSDNQGNIYLGGSFEGEVDFDFDATVQSYTSTVITNRDICFAKYNPNGNFIFNYQFGGGTSSHEAYQACITSSNEIILAGGYSDVVDFDPSPATNTLNPIGDRDIFFNKYTQCIAPDTPTLSVTSTTICANTTATLSITGGTLNSASSWVWSQGSCGSSTIGVGTTVTVSPTFPTTYFVRGEGGCITPTVCASASVSVESLKDITGSVTSSANPVAGVVVLYRYEGPLTKWDSVTYQNINPAGIYSISAALTGSYVLMCLPTATNLQTTYAPASISWKGATVFSHGCLSTTSLNVNVQPILNLGGPGILSGKIVEGQGYEQRGNGITAPGNPIKGIIVKGGRNPGGDIVAQSRTNASGEYTLGDLAISAGNENYFILVEIPGLDTNGTHRRAVVTGSLQYTGLDFIVDSSYIHPVLNVGLDDLTIDGKSVKVFPNPSNGIFTLQYDALMNDEIGYRVVDITGRVITESMPEKTAGLFEKQLDFTALKDGVYFMNITVNGNSYRSKMIISRSGN